MQFLYAPLTWGFILVGVPILVHLINLLRHRRRKWAAMEFLLESYRRNRRWVMLKQWLLLLSRMLAMFLLVMMLAKWVSSAQWLGWLGGRTTHHLVLLDDSYSMGAIQPSGESAYARALQALDGLLQDIASQPGDHQITVLRWSRAFLALRDAGWNDRQLSATAGPDLVEPSALAGELTGQIDLAADLLAQSLPPDPRRLIDRIAATEPTGLQLQPEAALELIEPSIASQSGEQPIVYLLTDLRRNQFSEAQALRNCLERLADWGAAVQVIDCAESEGQNLSVTNLMPEQEVWAAGVPLLVRFSVRNASAQTARNVVVKTRTVNYPLGEVTPVTEGEFSGRVMDLPPVVIESIEPEQTVTRQFQVVFPTAGPHVVEVSLPDDVLLTDNRRLCVINIRRSQRVLLVDGDALQSNAFYFESVIQPGERLQTGMTFDKLDTGYLRDAAAEELALYDVIVLLDVPRIEPQAVDKLNDYVRAGGGLLMVCGGNTNLDFANAQLYRDGQGLLPVELSSLAEGDELIVTSGAQVSPADHPILQPLSKLSANPFLGLRLRKQWIAAPQSLQLAGVEVVAMGPNQQPLIVDRPLGAGRVVAVLTGLTADWSTWAQDPTFVVLALRSLGYLSSFRREPVSSPVGSHLTMLVAQSGILPEGEVLFPGRAGQRVRWQLPVDISESDPLARLTVAASLQATTDGALIDQLLRPGLFECWMTTSDGGLLLRNVAHNPAPEEGNLERTSHQELLRQFQGVDLTVRGWTSLVGGTNFRETAQSNLAMALLIALLIGEQLLAYSASYHAPADASAPRLSRRFGVGR